MALYVFRLEARSESEAKANAFKDAVQTIMDSRPSYGSDAIPNRTGTVYVRPPSAVHSYYAISVKTSQETDVMSLIKSDIAAEVADAEFVNDITNVVYYKHTCDHPNACSEVTF